MSRDGTMGTNNGRSILFVIPVGRLLGCTSTRKMIVPRPPAHPAAGISYCCTSKPLSCPLNTKILRNREPTIPTAVRSTWTLETHLWCGRQSLLCWWRLISLYSPRSILRWTTCSAHDRESDPSRSPPRTCNRNVAEGRPHEAIHGCMGARGG